MRRSSRCSCASWPAPRRSSEEGLRNLDLSNLDRCGPLGHKPRQEREGSRPVGGLDLPPETVPADKAAGRNGAVPERAVEAMPGGKCGRTLVRLVLVVEDESGHAAILSPTLPRYIGVGP